MTDRELLKLAAKAAAIELVELDAYEDVLPDGTPWNPLTDDGDALRLIVALGIDLLFTPEDVEAVATHHARQEDGELLSPWACESWTLKPQDTYAATRRAIVRAAAEIGKSQAK